VYKFAFSLVFNLSKQLAWYPSFDTFLCRDLYRDQLPGISANKDG